MNFTHVVAFSFGKEKKRKEIYMFILYTYVHI